MMPLEDGKLARSFTWTSFFFFILEEVESAHRQLMSDVTLEMKHTPLKMMALMRPPSRQTDFLSNVWLFTPKDHHACNSWPFS